MLIEKLKARFGAALKQAELANNDNTIVVERDAAFEIFKALRDEPDFAFNMLVDVTAVDWLKRKPRFDVVYHLNSIKHGHRLRVKVGVGGEPATAHSVASLWKSADWLERECFDMFGVRFESHPDLRRILMYDSFVGYPLRKDYPVSKRQPLVDEVDPVLNPRRSSI